ncbi:Transposase IS4 [Popillia japonica]|uniref:Transposase IS4 n=1 Tax=Popillia japonica TaxID=7064 RepID=A0AAW1LB24_POPJA
MDDGGLVDNLISRQLRANAEIKLSDNRRIGNCADNTKIDETDRAWKIRPLMEMLKKKCTENFIPEEHLAYDESMVKYFGRHGCKQFIRGKPIRFGYKIWSLNTKDGYLVNFELYQGKGPKANTDYDKLFGKCASPLLVLLDEMPDAKKYSVSFLNIFSACTKKINVINKKK